MEKQLVDVEARAKEGGPFSDEDAFQFNSNLMSMPTGVLRRCTQSRRSKGMVLTFMTRVHFGMKRRLSTRVG